ncbi:MAG: hypothetical protein GY809_08385 [Planctomycetes bacterium]|nr:hypothetical protein [Planctomycetota bacterium]
MHPPRLEAIGTEESAAFQEMLETVERQVDRIIHICEHGLSRQTAQSLTRLIAATKPQYIMRSTLIPISQRKKFDDATIKIWVTKIFAGTPAADDPQVHEQLQIPIPMGGYGAGGVMQKAPAAFLTGTIAAMAEIHKAAGTIGVDGLRRVHPRLIQQLESATQEVKNGTGFRSVDGWMVDRPMSLKGKQR